MRTLRRLGVVLVMLAGLLALAEAAFRLQTEVPWYSRQREQGETVPVRKVAGQAFKTRHDFAAAPKEAGTFRILFLGDSFTYGLGVADDRLVFPSLVAERLQALRAPATIEFFNGGIPGTLTPRWVELFHSVVEPFQPDLVVTVFFLRAGTRNIGGSIGHIRRIAEEMARLEDSSWLFRTSRVYRYFRERSAQRAFSREYLESMHRAYLGSESETREWNKARANLLELREETERRGARFALVLFPVLFQLDRHHPLADVCAEIDRFAAEHGILYDSLLPTFLGLDAPDLWVSPLDQHPNEHAHALAATAITAFLEPLLPPAEPR